VWQELAPTREIISRNFDSYGMTEGNRNTLLLRYCHEQGSTKRLVTVDELFRPRTLEFTEVRG
jgi:hypothetical protein